MMSKTQLLALGSVFCMLAASAENLSAPSLFNVYDQAAIAAKVVESVEEERANVTVAAVKVKTPSAVSSNRTVARAVSYTVRGKRYTTLSSSEGFSQEGSASWYGGKFHGRKTASGEIFDMYAMTAAHKRLPLGTKIEVTNKATGKSIVVTVNDRGPFHGDRILDLSKGAAQKLGVINQGTANVSIRAL
ncbi:septal ring lytic transglycosylase RlpA family protein [Suttonella sp. R2A3]|uniref:septal ring lytic transglycosylase RlpA family protein n=1 Tax=Suttonella sp. R2A3 TaxID=2908648 RepID=UPI001F34C86D|nr:septal ring lytic transglycosylase RlpA family protein [Suttonella sp. R2A3]UJF24296.1 septal ring lytic transglycosylase RlpA family protein [Suttonella sp. R2A3]